MKISTKKLLATVEAAIKAEDAEAKRRTREAREKYDKAKADWLASDKPQQLGDHAKAIASKARRQQVITRKDLANLDADGFNGRARDLVFDASEPTPVEPRYGSLVALRDVLKTVTDEEISSTTLREMGFMRLERLLRRAVTR